jgi:hypothetical protein
MNTYSYNYLDSTFFNIWKIDGIWNNVMLKLLKMMEVISSIKLFPKQFDASPYYIYCQYKVLHIEIKIFFIKNDIMKTYSEWHSLNSSFRYSFPSYMRVRSCHLNCLFWVCQQNWSSLSWYRSFSNLNQTPARKFSRVFIRQAAETAYLIQSAAVLFVSNYAFWIPHLWRRSLQLSLSFLTISAKT